MTNPISAPSRKELDVTTTQELQIAASRILCELVRRSEDDPYDKSAAAKVLALQMISAGGNNKAVVKAFAEQFQKYGR